MAKLGDTAILSGIFLSSLHPQASTRQHAPIDLVHVEEFDDPFTRIFDSRDRAEHFIDDVLAIKL
ncbi:MULTISPECIES: hypothetical protein [Rhizobium]|uniref:hypothetical protein n=1 Tax=Rhizobium TaxID=379 RepID=UPI001FEFE7BB|nr:MULTISPECIES: hypothetical protein [Rhizobium]